jgi:hypothetical protein
LLAALAAHRLAEPVGGDAQDGFAVRAVRLDNLKHDLSRPGEPESLGSVARWGKRTKAPRSFEVILLQQVPGRKPRATR